MRLWVGGCVMDVGLVWSGGRRKTRRGRHTIIRIVAKDCTTPDRSHSPREIFLEQLRSKYDLKWAKSILAWNVTYTASEKMKTAAFMNHTFVRKQIVCKARGHIPRCLPLLATWPHIIRADAAIHCKYCGWTSITLRSVSPSTDCPLGTSKTVLYRCAT